MKCKGKHICLHSAVAGGTEYKAEMLDWSTTGLFGLSCIVSRKCVSFFDATVRDINSAFLTKVSEGQQGTHI